MPLRRAGTPTSNLFHGPVGMKLNVLSLMQRFPNIDRRSARDVNRPGGAPHRAGPSSARVCGSNVESWLNGDRCDGQPMVRICCYKSDVHCLTIVLRHYFENGSRSLPRDPVDDIRLSMTTCLTPTSFLVRHSDWRMGIDIVYRSHSFYASQKLWVPVIMELNHTANAGAMSTSYTNLAYEPHELQ